MPVRISLTPRFSGVALSQRDNLEGGSSHWVNENALVAGKFGWGRGYGVFSVSHSGIEEVTRYIAQQREHHRKRSFADELKLLAERYGLKWREV
ncbi:MAG TPA: transposase [Verrucomicrobiae bacterium]|nr:transposase [Verrucomicrobiae bacterium]